MLWYSKLKIGKMWCRSGEVGTVWRSSYVGSSVHVWQTGEVVVVLNALPMEVAAAGLGPLPAV